MLKAGYIAIIGRPNAGKSTLLNKILDTQLSIVTPKAQTTRNKILGIYTETQGQVVFMDTPGIHRAKEGGINHFMVNEAKIALESPNLIWYLVDPKSGLEHEEDVLELLKQTSAPLFLLINKIDQVMNEPSPRYPNKFRPGFAASSIDKLEQSIKDACLKREIKITNTHRISGLSGAGLPELLKESWELMPEGPFFYPDTEQVSDRPTRFFVAEKIREQLYHLLGDEVPYSCAIEIETFNENTKPVRIEAVIHVERDSQKGMVIGNGGHKIKEIGQAARHEIEEFLGEKIFLGLKVKLLKEWSRNSENLRKMGYDLPKMRNR